VLCLFGGFGCSIVSDEEEAIRVLCDLIFLIILRDKQKNNAKHSLAAIETITTSQHSFLSAEYSVLRESLLLFDS